MEATPRLSVSGLNEAQCAVAARAGTYDYYVKLVKGFLEGICPFCRLDPTVNNVVLENDHWRSWPNTVSPEKGTKSHYLIVPRRHVLDIRELTNEEWMLLLSIMKRLFDDYDIVSCGFFVRNGDATNSAGTIPHLHFQTVEPAGTERVEVPFYKGAASEATGHARAILFERLRTGAAVPSDFSTEEMELLTNKQSGDRLKGYVAPTI